MMLLFPFALFSCNIDKPEEPVGTGSPKEERPDTDTSEDTDLQENETGESYTYSIPDISQCDGSYETEHGFLCALQPSRLDSNARDRFAEDSIGDRTLGFGYHVVGFPKIETQINGIYVHFTGSMGRAYNQDNGTFPSATLLDEAMQSGLIAIQIAYHNRYAVNSTSECIGSNDIDNCAGNVRREKITGEDLTPVVDVPLSDSITHRMLTLLAYLEAQDFTLPVSIVEDSSINWANLMIGGHSQGAGHALYITKYWNSVHTCLFGGPYDVADTVPAVPAEAIADWYLDDSVIVDTTKIQALLSVDDNNYDNFVRAYNVLNMTEGTHWQSFQAAEYIDSNGESISGHGAVVHDPAFHQQRYTACFRYAQ